MIHLRRMLVVVVAVLAVANFTTSLALAQDPANGKVIYEETVWQCSRCHGEQAEGAWSRPLSNSTLTEQEWIDQVRNPRRNMPAFSASQISDEQILDIRAHILTLPAPAADFAPRDPGTSDNPGQNVFWQKRCVACHDPDTGPMNGYVERGEQPTVQGVIAQLRTPKNRMPAYSEAQVSDADATLIANFLVEQFAQHAAPATLPTSGSESAPTWPAWLIFAGGLIAAGGFVLRRFVTRSTAR
ncbi:MAG TPA: c-type cytochrome [Anaerolineae bacterium]|nr:c-type cytochrome [Anaerolineae bacterium]